MNFLESTIHDYITIYGSEDEKDVHALYQGDYKETFAHSAKDLEEASGLAGGGVILFSVLTFILECVGASLVQGTVDKGKTILRDRLIRNRSAIVKKAPVESEELTKETVEKLISLLQAQLEQMEDDSGT